MEQAKKKSSKTHLQYRYHLPAGSGTYLRMLTLRSSGRGIYRQCSGKTAYHSGEYPCTGLHQADLFRRVSAGTQGRYAGHHRGCRIQAASGSGRSRPCQRTVGSAGYQHGYRYHTE